MSGKEAFINSGYRNEKKPSLYPTDVSPWNSGLCVGRKFWSTDMTVGAQL